MTASRLVRQLNDCLMLFVCAVHFQFIIFPYFSSFIFLFVSVSIALLILSRRWVEYNRFYYGYILCGA